MNSFDSSDEIQRWAIDTILANGKCASPRGIPTREILGISVVLKNPRRRCITNPARGWSLGLAIGEFSWHASGANDVEPLAYYAPRWRKFADSSGKVGGSCYGSYIFRPQSVRPSQWQTIKELLRSDPDSRRAVLTFRDKPVSADVDVPDIACASTFQFLIRDGRLHAIVNMRSNDVFLGLPYDLFVFTMLHELLAVEIGVELGTYYHQVGSLHLYERDRIRAMRILETAGPEFAMPRMDAPSELPSFLACETDIRKAGFTNSPQALSSYWRDLAHVLLFFRQMKMGYLEETASLQSASPYRDVLEPYSQRMAL
jgi:thymidylate synthase